MIPRTLVQAVLLNAHRFPAHENRLIQLKNYSKNSNAIATVYCNGTIYPPPPPPPINK